MQGISKEKKIWLLLIIAVLILMSLATTSCYKTTVVDEEDSGGSSNDDGDSQFNNQCDDPDNYEIIVTYFEECDYRDDQGEKLNGWDICSMFESNEISCFFECLVYDYLPDPNPFDCMVEECDFEIS